LLFLCEQERPARPLGVWIIPQGDFNLTLHYQMTLFLTQTAETSIKNGLN